MTTDTLDFDRLNTFINEGRLIRGAWVEKWPGHIRRYAAVIGRVPCPLIKMGRAAGSLSTATTSIWAGNLPVRERQAPRAS